MMLIGALAYVLYTGRVPGLSQAAKKISQSGSDSDEERVARDLQARIAADDHQAAFKLWQRIKSFDTAPEVSLAGVVRAMRGLGKSNGEVVGELRSALECNLGLGEGVGDLLEELCRDGPVDLLNKLVAMLKDKGFKVDSHITERLAGAQSGRSSGSRAKSPGAQEP